ncbi:radical SAM protein [Candidatus Kaiserbacteria bacterium]|nr:radical SAM protein [Candidatus Kaiserbacteria bacterium]
MAELGMNGSIDVTTPAWIPDFNFSAPDTVFFEVTRACNLRCSHCLNASGVRSMDELTQKQRLSMIDDLAETGVQEIRFTGGEPMILDGLGELLARATALNLRTSMGTNAVLATEKNVHRFARFLHMAIVSIDGMEDRHDSIRGRGAFRRTMAGMENFLSYSIKVRVNTVIMRSGIHDTVALAEHLYNRGIPLFVRRLVPSGRATDMLSEVLNKEEYEQVCVQLKPYLADPRGLTQGHYLNERALETRIRLPFRRSSCSAGHRGMVTLPNGNMQTCGFLGSLGEPSVGKVPDESLATIWKRLLVSNHIASLEDNLAIHNQYSTGPSTNCLAIALSSRICTPP